MDYEQCILPLQRRNQQTAREWLMRKTSDTLQWLLDKALSLGADHADTVHIAATDVSASQRLGQPEGIERSESAALGLRVFASNRQAIVSSTDMSMDALTEIADRAVAMAKIAPPDADSTLADTALLTQSAPDLDLYDANEPDTKWLTEQCQAAEDTARSAKGISNSEGADAGYSKSHITLAAAYKDGTRFCQEYRSSNFSISTSVLAGEGTTMERDYAFSSTRHRADLTDAAAIGEEAARRTLERIKPRKAKTCQAPVVFDPRVSRTMLHVLAGAINGSGIARKASFLKEDMGKQIFTPSITISDDPHRPRGLGSKPFDGEGVAAKKLVLVENGTLKQWLLSTRSANKLGLTTNGRASRGIGSAPSPSSSNLYMHAGDISAAELMSDIKSGLYVTETFGMGVNIITGDYSQGAAGFWIENGKIAYPVAEVTIAGSLRDMFMHMTPADDLVFDYATNAPTLRIDGMTIAGSA